MGTLIRTGGYVRAIRDQNFRPDPTTLQVRWTLTKEELHGKEVGSNLHTSVKQDLHNGQRCEGFLVTVHANFEKKQPVQESVVADGANGPDMKWKFFR